MPNWGQDFEYVLEVYIGDWFVPNDRIGIRLNCRCPLFCMLGVSPFRAFGGDAISGIVLEKYRRLSHFGSNDLLLDPPCGLGAVTSIQLGACSSRADSSLSQGDPRICTQAKVEPRSSVDVSEGPVLTTVSLNLKVKADDGLVGEATWLS